MSAFESLDVRLGLFTQSPFWVRYCATGLITTHKPAAQLHAVINFHESMNQPPVPVGTIARAEGGFLRAKKTTYQVVIGGRPMPGIIHETQLEAKADAMQRALRIGAGITYGVPEITPYATNPGPFMSDAPMFISYWYGSYIDADQRTTLHSTVHYPPELSCPSVSFLLTEMSDPQEGYIWGFTRDGSEMVRVRTWPTVDDASSHLIECLPSVASSLLSIHRASDPLVGQATNK